MKRVLVTMLALSLCACASGTGEFAKGSGKTLPIHKNTWASYEEYLGKLQNTHPGAFVVTADGSGSAWTWCGDVRCRTDTGYANDALKYCRDSYKMQCFVFARGSDIVVNYEVVD